MQYTSAIYQNQSKLIEQSFSEKNITYLEYLKSQKSLVKKMHIIDAYYTRKLLDTLYFIRNGKEKKEHMESIPRYLEESYQLIKQRKSKGYLFNNYALHYWYGDHYISNNLYINY